MPVQGNEYKIATFATSITHAQNSYYENLYTIGIHLNGEFPFCPKQSY